MIPKSAVREFLSKPRDNHLWIKKLSKDELWDAIDELRPRPQLYEGMRRHQLACFLLGVSYPQFAFWLDLGAGKTLLILELLRYWHQCGKLRQATIFLKSDKAFLTWEKQIALYKIGLPYVCLEGSSERKWQQLEEFGDEGLVIVPRPGARAMISKPVRAGRKDKVVWKVDPKRIKRFVEKTDAIVLDESTDDAHYTSLTHKMVKAIQPYVPIRYALAGRPVGRDPTLLWGQHYLVDEGETLGPTLGLFREAFFTAEKNPFARSEYAKDYTFKKKMLPKLTELMQHRSIAYSSEECGIHIKVEPIIEEVRFSEEAAIYYKKAVDSIIAAKGNLREVKNVFLRMRQLSSGFVGFKDDETGERAEVEFDENPKFDRQVELLEEVPRDTKSVVFYEFTFSGRKLADAAKKLGLNPVWLWSGTKDSSAELRRFEKDNNCRTAIIQWRVGAYSLDGLQDVASYSFFYESPVSAIDREQAERRLRRQGQKKLVRQYDLITRGSADAKILAFHAEAEDLMKAVLRDPSVLRS